MGSVNNAVRCGFICRLCSRIDKRVVHIYGELGRKFNLVQKIRDYLPIKIKSSDGLPLTLCVSCVQRLNRRHTVQLAAEQNSSSPIVKVTVPSPPHGQEWTHVSDEERNSSPDFLSVAVQSI